MLMKVFATTVALAIAFTVPMAAKAEPAPCSYLQVTIPDVNWKYFVTLHCIRGREGSSDKEGKLVNFVGQGSGIDCALILLGKAGAGEYSPSAVVHVSMDHCPWLGPAPIPDSPRWQGPVRAHDADCERGKAAAPRSGATCVFNDFRSDE